MLDSYYLYLISVGDMQVQNCRYGALGGLIKRFATPYWMVGINPLKFQKVDMIYGGYMPQSFSTLRSPFLHHSAPSFDASNVASTVPAIPVDTPGRFGTLGRRTEQWLEIRLPLNSLITEKTPVIKLHIQRNTHFLNPLPILLHPLLNTNPIPLLFAINHFQFRHPNLLNGKTSSHGTHRCGKYELC